MILLPIEFPEIDQLKMSQIEIEIRAIYRLITFSRKHRADDLLDRFLSSTQNLKELLSIKNAQMEAQDEEEAQRYIIGLNEALNFETDEINANRTFDSQV